MTPLLGGETTQSNCQRKKYHFLQFVYFNPAADLLPSASREYHRIVKSAELFRAFKQAQKVAAARAVETSERRPSVVYSSSKPPLRSR